MHPLLHPTASFSKFHHPTRDRQNMEKFTPMQSRHTDLVDPQLKAAHWYLATMHGDLPLLQSLQHRVPRVSSTLPLQMPLSQTHLGSLSMFWLKWGAPHDVTPSWSFILLGEVVFEHEDNPPSLQGYHVGGFSYNMQPLDILRSFILYFLWFERSRKDFDDQISSRKVLQQA